MGRIGRALDGVQDFAIQENDFTSNFGITGNKLDRDELHIQFPSHFLDFRIHLHGQRKSIAFLLYSFL